MKTTLNIDASTYGSVSLLARVQDNTHLYFFGWNDAMGEWMIAVRNGPTVTILATSAPYSLVYNQDYVVRADVQLQRLLRRGRPSRHGTEDQGHQTQ